MFEPLPEGTGPIKQIPVEDMYNQAKGELNDENFDAAIKLYEALQSYYPYGRYAQQAMLEMAYAYYRQGEAESAVSTADRFIKQYPTNPHVDYAYYVKGLANFNGEVSILKSISGQDPTERDPKAAQESFNTFRELVTRFPDSKYAPDSRLRMQYLVNMLAKHELHVARYYLRRGAYIAAINRAQGILTQFPNSPSTRGALEVMAQAYDAMGMTDLRDDTRRVLAKNGGMPASPAGDEAPAGETQSGKSWWQFWK